MAAPVNYKQMYEDLGKYLSEAGRETLALIDDPSDELLAVVHGRQIITADGFDKVVTKFLLLCEEIKQENLTDHPELAQSIAGTLRKVAMESEEVPVQLERLSDKIKLLDGNWATLVKDADNNKNKLEHLRIESCKLSGHVSNFQVFLRERCYAMEEVIDGDAWKDHREQAQGFMEVFDKVEWLTERIDSMVDDLKGEIACVSMNLVEEINRAGASGPRRRQWVR
ncbi:MAG: hypothetical protein Q9221_008374 [Calogaya cf. arnoldii]